MAHLLIIELPGGNDVDIISAALARGDEFTFLSAQLDHYRRQPAVWTAVRRARGLIEVSGFGQSELEHHVLAVHARQPIDAVLCLIEIRLIEAALLAALLGVPHLNPASAELLRDKVKVRQRLAACGIAQPDFALAESNAQLKAAVHRLGLPVLIKPADGYGSQNIVVLREAVDLDPLMTPLDDMLPSRADYGLGVHANDRLLVERYMTGSFVGIDTLTVNGRHRVIGLHRKLMFEPPSFAMRGSSFSAEVPAEVERYVLALLDAVGFDWGATHIELMLTREGPRLIEINPRLVGARMPRLVSHALGRSLHTDLIAVHLGQEPPAAVAQDNAVGAIRWVVAAQRGVLNAVHLPDWTDPRIRCVDILKQSGDGVGPPFENADRIGCVMACAPSAAEAESLAERYVAGCRVEFQSTKAPVLQPA